MSVTVAEILNLPAMRGATVVAGQEGLENRVRWVHVSELLDIARLLKGGELLLTTGMGLSVPAEQQVQYIRDLSGRGVAAVAIALVPSLGQVPPAMITAAEAAGLPLLAFHAEVPFVQITEEVHTLIVNRHYAQFRHAEAVAHQLNEAALQNQNATAILRILHQVLKNPVACVSHDDGRRDGAANGQADAADPEEGALRSYYPPGDWGPELMAKVAGIDMKAESNGARAPRFAPAPVFASAAAPLIVPLRLGRRTVDVWLQPIVVSGERWGHLAVVQSNRKLDEVERLVVDRAAVTLAYEILRRRSLREHRRGTAAQLAESILNGDVPQPEHTIRRARALGHELENRWLAVGVVQGPAGLTREEAERRVTAACGRLHLKCLATWRAGRLALLFHAEDAAALRARLAALAQELEGTAGAAGKAPASGRFVTGFSRLVAEVEAGARAVEQAEFTLALRQREATRGVGPLFESLGTYRLLAASLNPKELRGFIQDELGPLLQLPEPEASLLLRTLRVLLDTNLSVVITARELGVSRQTIYQRSTRIERTLQCSLAEPERRVALSMALRALDTEPLGVHGARS